jgi:hypothetical protein
MDIMYFILYALTILCWFLQYPFRNVSLYLVSCICDTLDDGLSKPKHVVKERVQ